MKTHILFILDYYLPHRGGVETVFEQIINGLHKKGYKITILTSRFDKKLAEYEIDNNNIELDLVESLSYFVLGSGESRYCLTIKISPGFTVVPIDELSLLVFYDFCFIKK